MVVLRPNGATTQTAAETLSDLLAAADVEIIKLSGTAERPRAIVRAKSATIEHLTSALGDRLLIAPDSNLELFPSGPKPTSPGGPC